MSVIVVNSRSSKSSSYGNLFVTENDKIATKMTAMEDLEQREQEIKSKLELADSLEERKQLRTELREIRRKIFEGPVSSSPAVKVDVKPDPPKTTTRIVKEENAKNLELNSNKILTKTSSLKNSTPEPKSQTSTTRTTATTNKINMSVARRSRLFQTDDNNNNSKPEPTPTGPKLKIQAQGDDVPALRTRDPTDRAARRARRAQQQREMSIDQGIGTEKKEEAKTSIVVDTPKENVKPEEERKPSSTSIKVSSSNSSLSVKNEEKPKGSTEIRRSGTWGGSKDRAAGNIGKALNKFGAQSGSSPFQFGIDYKNKPTTQKQESPRTYNKYTPGVATVKTPVTPCTNTETTKNDSTPEMPVSSGEKNSLENRRPSLNKYNSPITNLMDAPKTETKPEPKPFEFGTSFAPKKFTPSRDIINQIQSSPRPTPSYNKYAPSLNNNKNPDTGLNKVGRSISMRAVPTYERHKAPVPEPSLSYGKPGRTMSENSGISGLNPVTGLNRSAANNRTGLNHVYTSNVSGLNVTGTDNVTGLNRVGTNTETNSVTGLNQTGMSGLRSIFEKDASKPAGTTLKTTRPTSSYGGGRFSSLKSDPLPPPPPQPEPAQQSNGPPSFGSGGSQSAGDRMAFFRQAAEKEKEKAEKKKANEESRRKQMEMVNALMNGEMEMAKTKTEEKEPPKTEKKEPPKTEKKETQKTEKREMKDSDKMRNASAPCMKKREKKKVTRRTMSIGSIVLDWVQEMIKDYPVKVTNFSSSWNNGMAFCALIHHFNPDEFDFSTLKPENKRENFDLAFETGMKAKKIPILLDTEDMVVMERPEPRSVQTYIQWIWSVYGPTSGYGPTPQEVQK